MRLTPVSRCLVHAFNYALSVGSDCCCEVLLRRIRVMDQFTFFLQKYKSVPLGMCVLLGWIVER